MSENSNSENGGLHFGMAGRKNDRLCKLDCCLGFSALRSIEQVAQFIALGPQVVLG